MNRRIKAIDLMRYLQSFTQGGIISGYEAKEIIDEYIRGNNEPLSALAFNPSLPMQYINLTKSLANFIQ